MEYIGELAALSTAALWALCSIFFAEAGRSIGSFNVNKIRLVVAVLIYSLVLLIVEGRLVAPGLTQDQILWLSVSGIVGLVFGDSCGFKALVMIGPRLTTVMYATSPIMATIIAWVFLGERLHLWEIFGISLTIAGVTWIVLERRYKNAGPVQVGSEHPDSGSLFKGVMLGLGAALGQAVGLVLAKFAMTDLGARVEALEASFIRMLAAMIFIWLLGAVRGQGREVWQAMKNTRGVGFSAAGAVAGPFLGVWLSLVAILHIETGIASTLNATVPVFIIPVVIWYYREKVSRRAMIGAVVAVAGVSLIFLT
jgi:drug/metabolite transporter (DMT)-like permease